MKEYPFFIDRYYETTQHLNWDEHAAYRRLLDLYYEREEPIPLDREAVYQLTEAFDERRRKATDRVLGEFFVLSARGWVNQFCESVISQVRSGQ